jgi:hypothetical protein
MDIVGRIISGIDDRGTPDNKRECQEAIRLKRVDMVWLWKVIGHLITIGS